MNQIAALLNKNKLRDLKKSIEVARVRVVVIVEKCDEAPWVALRSIQ